MSMLTSQQPNPDPQSLSKLQETALTIFRNGYHPLRLDFGKKSPGHNGWQDKIPTEESIISDFSRKSNIGLLQGVIASDKTFPVTIDIDVDNGAVVSYVETTIGSDCPKKRGKKGISFLTRAVGDVRSRTIHLYHDGKKTPAGDILAKGKQTVIPPSIHPDTQLPYMWVGKLTPINTRYDELPLIDESVIDEIVAYCKDSDNPIAQLNDMVWKGVSGGGNTHDTCVAAVASMVSRGWSDDQILARIRRAKRLASEVAGEPYHWPAEAKVCQEWIDSAREKDFGQKSLRQDLRMARSPIWLFRGTIQ